jgi:hypothetical protein
VLLGEPPDSWFTESVVLSVQGQNAIEDIQRRRLPSDKFQLWRFRERFAQRLDQQHNVVIHNYEGSQGLNSRNSHIASLPAASILSSTAVLAV